MKNNPENRSKKKETIAIITYKTVGRQREYPNGFIDRNGKSAYLSQGDIDKSTPEMKNYSKKMNKLKSTIEITIREVEPLSPILDHVYLYVGAAGAERGIELTRNMFPGKLTYVMCSCNHFENGFLIDEKNPGAKIMPCECGGRETLKKVLEDFLGK